MMLRRAVRTKPAPAPAPQLKRLPVQTRRSSVGPVLAAVFLLVAGGAVAAFFVMQVPTTPSPASITVTSPPTSHEVSVSTTTTFDESHPINQPQSPRLSHQPKKDKRKRKKKGKRAKSQAKSEKKAKGKADDKREVLDPFDSKPALSAASAKRVFGRVHMLHCGGEGKVKVSVTISPKGKVSKASAPQGTVGACVADTVRSLRFPASADGLTTSHVYRW